MSYEPQAGDRVRIVLETTWEGDSSWAGFLAGTQELWSTFEDGDTATIEKIEPPVEVFGPQDQLRRKADGALIVLGERGYTYVRHGSFYEYGFAGSISERGWFTSERYEKVKLVEAPF